MAWHRLGGVPREHRTDSLSAAYVNTAQQQALTQAYAAPCQQAPLPELNVLQRRFLPHRRPPNTPSRQPAVDAYDPLLKGRWTTQEGAQV